jgi:23S rRNA (adenine2503-C2)-methyltransferase
MPVNDRYPLADVLAECERYYERAPQGLRRVRDARRRQRRYEQAAQLAELLDPRDLQGQPDPVQPDRDVYDGSSRGAIDAFKAALEEHGCARRCG